MLLMVTDLFFQDYNTDLDYKKLLVLSSVWIEPTSSAAGYRMLQLLKVFRNLDYVIHYATPALKTGNEYTEDMETHCIALNSDSFDEFVTNLEPAAVLYDRFMVEEQFGWRVRACFPEIIQVLDTEDLHFLRKARAKAVNSGNPLNLYTEDCKREIASILRCDLTIMISQFEIKLLEDKFQIAADQLVYLPFIYEPESKRVGGFDSRKNFLSIGGFMHAPNMDAVRQLKKLWPEIRKKTGAEIHLYGSYAGPEALQMNDPKTGFLIKGRAEAVDPLMNSYRVLLAPLRFGAGQKGKLFDALKGGMPSVTTLVGVEGMLEDDQQWSGMVADTDDAFVEAAANLYSDKVLWGNAAQNCERLLTENFSKNYALNAERQIQACEQNLLGHRQRFFVGEVMKTDQQARYKYLSKYIEQKNC